MEITVERLNNEVLFSIENAHKALALVDGAEQIGGLNKGLRPMEMLLGSLASCSAFDLVLILKKQRQEITALTIEVKGERVKNDYNKPFSSIHIDFRLSGTIDFKKAERAASLALEKYCSVKASLHPDISISHQVTLS